MYKGAIDKKLNTMQNILGSKSKTGKKEPSFIDKMKSTFSPNKPVVEEESTKKARR